MSGHLQPEVTKLPRLDQFLKSSINSNLQQISEPCAARMAEEKFSLRWNDFQASLSSSFQQFRGQLTDVELCCLGGRCCSGQGPGEGPGTCHLAPGILHLTPHLTPHLWTAPLSSSPTSPLPLPGCEGRPMATQLYTAIH